MLIKRVCLENGDLIITDYQRKNHFFISLNYELCGFYMEVAADSREKVVEWARANLGKRFCSVYTYEQLTKQDISDGYAIGNVVYLKED